MREIIYISGGQRSGKSNFAQTMTDNMSDNPVYLATAKCWDKEFEKRIKRHQESRGEKWENIEEEIEISKHNLKGRVVMMDCVTLWLTNIFCECKYDTDRSLEMAKEEWGRFIDQDFTLIVVSNEIGMGVIPMDRSTRAFVDLQGWMNQHIAASADTVYTMISGLPLKLK